MTPHGAGGAEELVLLVLGISRESRTALRQASSRAWSSISSRRVRASSRVMPPERIRPQRYRPADEMPNSRLYV